MSGTVIIAYLAAGVLFIRSLAGLSRQETAARGNLYGMLGMGLAIVVAGYTWFARGHALGAPGLWMLVGAVAVGGAIGAVLARRVEMTGMPELVAILHSFVGLAAVFVGISSHLEPRSAAHLVPADVQAAFVAKLVAHLEVWAGVAVGALTFTGSIIAWAKLRGTLS